MSVINTNITAMIGQSNLNKSQNSLQTSMERLSSGLRINSAKDDAAGQAIANRMSSQITGLAQAQRNANDGISIAQTAEGSLNQVNDNLQRIRELSVQASNGTNSQNDLQSIQDEITQRLNEIDRISEETNFNGVSVLADEQALQIQVGANDGETITVNLQEINAETLGLDDFNVNGYVGDLDTTDTANSGAMATALGLDDSDFSTAGADFGAAYDAVDVDGLDGLPDGFTGGALGVDDNGNFFIEGDLNGETVVFSATVGVEFNDDGEVTALGVTAGSQIPGDGSRSEGPMAALDSALNQVDSLRSELGAVQNRFEDAITNLNTNETNLAAARSRIEDADYAVEVSDMTRAQILQQAGTSVLAQANQIPQNVLSLLG
ncbi:FliC/FljB family flagellin [Franzmannia qiaohouensis]|uniref:Flagellin n=1 Tax=Franzmannia qiaohouensis TaxID=1329370 RepID=A0ABU1HJ92_9GAMM|nr:FliC/FljB family flagellin [Halomonas qiaohouensis]MDR5907347.1 FliC/FljB family flagellin [Halomonas qiaohouensis]